MIELNKNIYPRKPSKNSLHYFHIVILAITQRGKRASEGAAGSAIGHLRSLADLRNGNRHKILIITRNGVVRSVVIEINGSRLIETHVV